MKIKASLNYCVPHFQFGFPAVSDVCREITESKKSIYSLSVWKSCLCIVYMYSMWTQNVAFQEFLLCGVKYIYCLGNLLSGPAVLETYCYQAAKIYVTI